MLITLLTDILTSDVEQLKWVTNDSSLSEICVSAWWDLTFVPFCWHSFYLSPVASPCLTRAWRQEVWRAEKSKGSVEDPRSCSVTTPAPLPPPWNSWERQQLPGPGAGCQAETKIKRDRGKTEGDHIYFHQHLYLIVCSCLVLLFDQRQSRLQGTWRNTDEHSTRLPMDTFKFTFISECTDPRLMNLRFITSLAATTGYTEAIRKQESVPSALHQR